MGIRARKDRAETPNILKLRWEVENLKFQKTQEQNICQLSQWPLPRLPPLRAQITTTRAVDHLANCVGAEDTSPQLYTEFQHHLHFFLPCSLKPPPHLNHSRHLLYRFICCPLKHHFCITFRTVLSFYTRKQRKIAKYLTTKCIFPSFKMLNTSRAHPQIPSFASCTTIYHLSLERHQLCSSVSEKIHKAGLASAKGNNPLRVSTNSFQVFRWEVTPGLSEN